jgi:hypothetical protein
MHCDIYSDISYSEAIRISEIWRSIPAQLVRENKKFLYSTIRKGARASAFESAIEWLQGMSGGIKGLRVFAEKFKPARIYRTSPRNFTTDNNFVNIPLYAVSRFPGLC